MDPNFRQKYQKYKYKVKLWEKQFKNKNGRIPSKYDIRDASSEIRDSYKMYYKLKTSFLEDTLSDVLSEDGFELSLDGGCGSQGDNILSPAGSLISLTSDFHSFNNCVSMSQESTFSNLEEIKSSGSCFSNITNVSEDHVIKHFEPTSTLALNEVAWGDKVCRKSSPVKIIKSSNPTIEFKTNLNTKLFANSSFSKRNPRKSLSRQSSGNITRRSSNLSLTGSEPNKETLPDLETILSQKSQMKAKENMLPSLSIKLQTDIKTDIDAGWLNRQEMKENHELHVQALPHIETKRFGMSNISADNFKLLSSENSVTTIDTNIIAESEEISFDKSLSTLGNSTVNHSNSQHSVQNKYGNSSDSVVSNSEDEYTTKQSQKVRHVIKKRRLEHIDSNKSPRTFAIKSNNTSPLNEPHNLIEKDYDELQENKVITSSQKRAPAKKLSRPKEKSNKTISSQKPVKKIAATKSIAKSTVKKHIDNASVQPPGGVRRSIRNKVNVSYNDNHEYDSELKPKEHREDVDNSYESVDSDSSVTHIKMKQKKLAIKKARSPKRKSSKMKVERQEQLLEQELEEKPGPNFHLPVDIERLKYLPSANVQELKKAESYLERYMQNVSTVTSTIQSRGPLSDKQAAAKEKLESKIASGSLNENFVRVNLKKKIFVRGKKTVNYSKYKKSLWKQKKAAALSGPDMDMGGCDGGVMTCFNCGKTGHFARNCKIKGDDLLPLDAHIVDDSPFPTLEEAEKMASGLAVAAHSRNIDKLPEAANELFYKDDSKMEFEDEVVENHEIPKSLELLSGETTNTRGNKEELKLSEQAPSQSYVGHKIPEDFLKQSGLLDTAIGRNGLVEPLYNLNPDGTLMSPSDEVIETLRMFGHKDFRKGQDRAIMRILSGQSTLVTLSTGSGKSLCYQLPAYLYSRKKKCITLVVSPLVSLMEDQVHGVPMFLNAQCLHTNQTPQQKTKIMEMVTSGNLDILLVSPEAVVAGERSTGFGSLLRQLPPIAFACIDEAHCVSQWSHNFRPSYLMICKVLKQKLGVRTILGLTATATLPTRTSIIRHLGIHDGENGIISDIPLPDNLILSVSKDENRDAALIQLLKSKRFAKCQSIIVYCTRRDECERVATFIRTCIQDDIPRTEANNRKRKRVNWNAEAYHAGMAASRRKTVQNAFMKNQLRIVVATIAFGMGINKPDIRAIIHYNMPRNFESYVQEVGRSGRDGELSHCHLFLDSKGADQSELRRHIYANSIDRHVIRKLLQRVFLPCSCESNFKQKNFVSGHQNEINAAGSINWDDDFFGCEKSKPAIEKRICPGHEVGFSVEETVEALDIPAENISTLLCYLELDGRWFLHVLSQAYITCKVISYGGPRQLKYAAKDCPPLAMAIALGLKNKTFDETSTVIEFSVIEIAAAIGWDSGVVKYQLKNLEWTTVDGLPKRSTISVAYFNLGFRIRAPGDLSDDELDETLDSLFNRSIKQEKTQLIQLQYVYEGLSTVTYKSCLPCCSDEFSNDRSEELKVIIRNYFQNDYPADMEIIEEVDTTKDTHITDDIRNMLAMYPENNFTGRTLARIFHGIQSPNYPAVMWGRCKYWRAHSKSNFNRIVHLANSVIVKMRT